MAGLLRRFIYLANLDDFVTYFTFWRSNCRIFTDFLAHQRNADW